MSVPHTLESHVNDKSKYLKTNTKIAMQKVVEASPMARPCQIRRGRTKFSKVRLGLWNQFTPMYVLCRGS